MEKLEMNEILLKHEGQPELRFTGQLVAETSFNADFKDEEKREFRLCVYAVEGGGYVAMLQYNTTSENEKPLVLYEDLDLFKDVENFFYLFEANEIMRKLKQVGQTERENLASLARRMVKAYESQMFKFLDLAHSRARQLELGDRLIEQPAKPSILRTLGLKK